jgi:deazaflavin-dependent oxidoreductase (nitroreductase family)
VADDDPEFAYLTTTGSRTGAKHSVELWYRRLGDTAWFLAGQRSDWIANATAHPAVTIRIGSESAELAGLARVVTGPDADDARRAMAARYDDWIEGQPLSGWALTATALAVDLVR